MVLLIIMLVYTIYRLAQLCYLAMRCIPELCLSSAVFVRNKALYVTHVLMVISTQPQFFCIITKNSIRKS